MKTLEETVNNALSKVNKFIEGMIIILVGFCGLHVFFSPILEYSYFSADLRLKYSYDYTWIIEKRISVKQCIYCLIRHITYY